MLHGVQTYRNPKIVHVLDKIKYIENFGTGIQRTIESYNGTNKNPEFIDGVNFFIIYLPNSNFRVENLPNKLPNKSQNREHKKVCVNSK